ncbi:MAG TPA: hypothetical protein VNK26_05815 [Pyrinomonadaceae bacterium]|nr:hypothetical protein [Pyrinomonadaceae bacterium]
MKKSKLLLTAIFSLMIFLTGCGSNPDEISTTKSNSGNNNGQPTNIKQGNSNTEQNQTADPLATKKQTPEPTTNNAPTLGPVYKAYCAAWEKRDEAALRRIYSSDTLKDFEQQMKRQGYKNLMELLAEDNASTQFCEVRNEKINGNEATAEVRTKGYPNGITIVFVKENGEWKMTNRQPEGALK